MINNYSNEKENNNKTNINQDGCSMSEYKDKLTGFWGKVKDKFSDGVDYLNYLYIKHDIGNYKYAIAAGIAIIVVLVILF